MEKRVISVSELNEYVKMLMDSDEILSSVSVRGEISNFTNHRTGHFYLTLKDEGSLIKAVMFRGHASKLKFLPENGMKVVVSGRVSAFVRDGQYQIYIETMEPDGIGALYIAYEQLKKKLTAEGLFDRSKKKPLPKIPTRIGIITSPTGAAVRDIINILGRRFPLCKPVLYPSLVQGDGAEQTLIRALDYFDRSGLVDTVIIGRGGGSIEDLWAFNSEALARRIFEASVPIMSAVGHETDFTICDFVADLRAPTPSAAAELAVPDVRELIHQIDTATDRCISAIKRLSERAAERFEIAGNELYSLAHDERLFDDRARDVKALYTSAFTAVQGLIEWKNNELCRAAGKAEAMSPLAVLSRGYSIAMKDGVGIRSIGEIAVGDGFGLRLTDGTVQAEVTGKSKLKRGK